jgi:molybdate transport system permease protein
LKYSHDSFSLVTKGALAFIIFFFFCIIASLAWYTDPNTFITALFSEEVLFAIRLSIITASLSTAICIVIAVPAAYAISRSKFPGKEVIDSLLDLPIVMPPIALGAALLIFFNTPIGAPIENNIINFVFQQSGLVLAQFAVISALAVRFMKTAFDGVDPKYEYAARTLGYNQWQTFLKVTLPMAKKGLLAAITLTWARAVGEFGASVTLAGATRMKTETLAIGIFLSLSTAEVEKAIAIVFILLIISGTVLLLIRKIGGKEQIGR